MNRRTLLRNALALLGCASPAALLTGPVQRSWAEVAKEMQRKPVIDAGALDEAVVILLNPEGEELWRQVVKFGSHDWADLAAWRLKPNAQKEGG